jgi:hypothetical protein
MAIAALVLGLLWGYGLLSVLAIIFGAIGMKQTADRNQNGRGLAIAGLVLGIVGAAIALILIIAAASSTTTVVTGYSPTACDYCWGTNNGNYFPNSVCIVPVHLRRRRRRFCPHCGAARVDTMPNLLGYAPGGMPPPIPPPGPPPASGPAAGTAYPPPTFVSGGAPTPKRDRGMLIGLGIAAVLVLVAIGVALYVGGVFSSTADTPVISPASHRDGSSGTSGGAAPTPAKPTAPANPTVPAAAPPSQPSSPAVAPKPTPVATPGPAATIQNHLEDLNSGDYQAAFRLMTASYQAENPSWPADRATADPGVTIISIGTPQSVSGGKDVPVDFYARDRRPSPGSDTQCREFQGTARLVSESGSWHYDPAASSLTSSVMPASDSNCPS